MLYKKRILILVACCLFVLSACAKPTEAVLTQATMDVLYTSVAQTLSVSMPTVTPQPTMTPSPTAALTLMATHSAAILATPTRTAIVSACDNSVFVSDVTIPDNTAMTPGQTFTKTWSIKNTGTCNWTTSYKVVFLSGSAMSGVSTGIPAITSGHADNISVTLVAPLTSGTYTGYWILQNANSQTFGASFSAVIVVSTSLTATTTGTITTTPTITPTPNIAATIAAGVAGTTTANAAATAIQAAIDATGTATALGTYTPR
ncbi:MAG: NBR1-Ig-like domain-containing protein [Chloroflexi bacterium]|nr:NBR1-Ig-like domain-containing protein [Chloroflexota bacterium]